MSEPEIGTSAHAELMLNRALEMAERWRILRDEAKEAEDRIVRERAKAYAEQERARTSGFRGAMSRWEHMKSLYVGNPGALAVLDIHRPCDDPARVVCGHCEESDGFGETQAVAWPCATNEALRTAARSMNLAFDITEVTDGPAR